MVRFSSLTRGYFYDINSSTVGLLPTESPTNPDWAWMAATCRSALDPCGVGEYMSKMWITIHKITFTAKLRSTGSSTQFTGRIAPTEPGSMIWG